MENTQRTERILSSLDGLQRTGAPEFFYTRLKGRMQRETEPVKERFFLLRPAFITTALTLLLLVNVFSLVSLGKQEKHGQAQTGKPATIESFASAYGMNTLSVYE